MLALRPDIPSLALLADLYGTSTPIEWLKTQLVSLNDFAETRLKLTPEQLDETAYLIEAAHPTLTAADICLFIARVKTGEYGSFYGSIDPMKIIAFLRQYASERSRGKHSVAKEETKEALVPACDQPVTYEKYQDTVHRASKGDPEALQALRRPSDR